ncbi:MAG: hypothetical protein JWN31_1742 [Frankiales bacterium]|nr:hypothetical protein [Frankiales bacterium]
MRAGGGDPRREVAGVKRLLLAGTAVALALVGFAPAQAARTPQALNPHATAQRVAARGLGPTFEVGAAVRSIRPATAAQYTHVGGYGDCLGCDAHGTGAVRAHDDLDARAVYVRSKGKAVVLASVPLEGWFAGYQEGSRLGLTDLRQEAAARISALGTTMTEADIIVNSNHCHSCPTVVGLWANTNPLYLRRVYDQTLAAIVAAAKAARPAHLRWAAADLGYVNDVVVGQANANEGWPVDGQLSVLQARDLHGRTIATWASVPVHGNIGFGPDLPEMTSEYFGAAARWFEAHQGGIGIVAAASLGDQTSPMQGDDTRLPGDRRAAPRARPGNKTPHGYPRAYDVMDRLGALVGTTAVEALTRHGQPMVSDAVGGAESYQVVPISNPLLVALLYGHALPDIPMLTHDGTFAGQRTADRSILPPYTVGAGVGVWFTTLRLGAVAVASEPGEAFPHVTQAIREVLKGAASTFVVGNAQDQLGYYYEEWAFPQTLYYSADHYLYNVGPTLAQQNIQAEVVNGEQLGFGLGESVESITAVAGNDNLRYPLKAGIQVWAYPQALRDPLRGLTIPLGVYWNDARGNEYGVPGAELHTGKPIVTVNGRPVPLTGEKTQFAAVTLPCAGDYRVHAALPGTSATWDVVIHVRSGTDVTNTVRYPSGTGAHPLAAQNAGDGHPAGCHR